MNAPLPVVPGLTLTSYLGHGSSGQVYAAHRDLDGWRCAVKVVTATSAEVVASVRREAAIHGHLRLPHLVHLHEVLDLPDGRIALVLDLVDGGDVGTLLAQRGHINAGEAVTVLAPVFETLNALHERGIVHGDVSAGNVLLTRDGRPVLTDLGAARLVGEQQVEVSGTTGFVAPELLVGGQPTAASDVYAAGALGWHLLTGSLASYGLVRPDLRDLVVGVAEELVGLVEDCLSGDPTLRPSAQDAATRALGCAPARPIGVPGGPDKAEQLTMRLRGGAFDLPKQAEPPGRHRPLPSDKLAAVRRGPVLALGVLGLGAATLAGRSLWIAGNPHVQAENSSQRHSLPGGVGPTELPAVTPTVQTTDRSLPRQIPVMTSSPGRDQAQEVDKVFTQLVQTRAEAYRRAEPGLLRDVFTGAVLDGDSLRVARLRSAGIRYEGVRYTVREASITHRAPGRLVLSARIDTSGYTIVHRDGLRGRRPAVEGERLRFTLQHQATGWRIAAMVVA